MTFRRTVEDFTCDYCAAHNTGDGYTNHCSRCLCSKHVDVDPGDREAACHGLMVPVDVEIRSGGTSIRHRCTSCRAERRCRTSPADDPDMIAAVSAPGGPFAEFADPPSGPPPRRRPW